MIEFRANKPTIQEYRNLYESTGWVLVKSISDVMLQKAIENSWFCVSVYDDETIIGIGRLISDGALYAFVCDMIVLPSLHIPVKPATSSGTKFTTFNNSQSIKMLFFRWQVLSRII